MALLCWQVTNPGIEGRLVPVPDGVQGVGISQQAQPAEWKCERCTYLNDAARRYCDMCRAEKPSVIISLTPAPAPEPPPAAEPTEEELRQAELRGQARDAITRLDRTSGADPADLTALREAMERAQSLPMAELEAPVQAELRRALQEAQRKAAELMREHLATLRRNEAVQGLRDATRRAGSDLAGQAIARLESALREAHVAGVTAEEQLRAAEEALTPLRTRRDAALTTLQQAMGAQPVVIAALQEVMDAAAEAGVAQSEINASQQALNLAREEEETRQSNAVEALERLTRLANVGARYETLKVLVRRARHAGVDEDSIRVAVTPSEGGRPKTFATSSYRVLCTQAAYEPLVRGSSKPVV